MKAIISGGGTGGHIFPALSIANALRRRDPNTEILFVGANGRMEMQRVPDAGYNIVCLDIAGFDRKRLWRNFSVLIKLFRSRRKAKNIIRQFSPDIVIGVGGYASGPTLLAAQKMHIPTLIQEQNSYAGVTNKHLGKNADCICVAYDGMDRFFPADKIILTGNPVRQAITSCTLSQKEAKAELGFDPEKPLVAAVGGSLGARTLNQAMHAYLPTAIAENTQILWQTGKFYADEYTPLAKPDAGLQITPFIAKMELVYRAADLIVSRAGASTISELQLVGTPAILIPSPNVAEDHQRKNAQALASVNAAVMILDADAVNDLPSTISSLLADKDSRASISANALKMGLPNADERIIDQIYNLVSAKNK